LDTDAPKELCWTQSWPITPGVTLTLNLGTSINWVVQVEMLTSNHKKYHGSSTFMLWVLQDTNVWKHRNASIYWWTYTEQLDELRQKCIPLSLVGDKNSPWSKPDYWLNCCLTWVRCEDADSPWSQTDLSFKWLLIGRGREIIQGVLPQRLLCKKTVSRIFFNVFFFIYFFFWRH